MYIFLFNNSEGFTFASYQHQAPVNTMFHFLGKLRAGIHCLTINSPTCHDFRHLFLRRHIDSTPFALTSKLSILPQDIGYGLKNLCDR